MNLKLQARQAYDAEDDADNDDADDADEDIHEVWASFKKGLSESLDMPASKVDNFASSYREDACYSPGISDDESDDEMNHVLSLRRNRGENDSVLQGGW